MFALNGLAASFLVYDISVEGPDAPRLPLEAQSQPCPAEWFRRG